VDKQVVSGALLTLCWDPTVKLDLQLCRCGNVVFLSISLAAANLTLADNHNMPPARWLQQGAAMVCLALLRSPTRRLDAARLMDVLPAGWRLYKAGNTCKTLRAWGWLGGLFELVLEGTVLYVTFGSATRGPLKQPALAPGKGHLRGAVCAAQPL
jgi:hypothetical protein